MRLKTREENYNLNVWRYNSEYSAHMYGWFATGWAKGKNIPIISDLAESSYSADIEESWDLRFRSLIPTLTVGIMGY